MLAVESTVHARGDEAIQVLHHFDGGSLDELDELPLFVWRDIENVDERDDG